MTSTPHRPYLILSIDLDMWYHCRWATGGPHSLWTTPAEAVGAYYGEGASVPPEELTVLTERTLALLDDAGITATFFILGEVAQGCPEVVRRIHSRGHEIASHGMHHCDADRLSDDDLRRSVRRSRALLEEICESRIVGFRYPNLVVGRREVHVLAEEGFRYDSSVCFSRGLFGKFGHRGKPTNNPYHPSMHDPFSPGATEFWELPIPVFPILRLPAGSGIATRLLGVMWSYVALRMALRTGDTVYYFHPYELGTLPGLRAGLNGTLFMRNSGERYARMLRQLLRRIESHAAIGPVRDWLARLSTRSTR